MADFDVCVRLFAFTDAREKVEMMPPKIGAAAAFLLPALPPEAAAAWAPGFAALLRPLHSSIWRSVPGRYWAQWYVLYVVITPVILSGYACGLVGH